MAIKLTLGSIEVTCDKPEEAMVLASAVGSLKPMKASDLAKLVERPITLKMNGVVMTCESPAAAAATLVAAGLVDKPRRLSSEVRGAQGLGPARAWELAEAYAQKHGITADEARRLIANKKREIKARSLVGAVEKKDQEFMQELQQLMDQIEGKPTEKKKKK